MVRGEAFDQVNILKIQIERLVKSSDNSQFQKALKFVYKQMDYIEEISKRTLYTDIDKAIISIVEKYVVEEDADLENQFSTEINLENLKQDLGSLARRLKKMEKSCADGLYNSLPDEEDDVVDVAVASKMIGVSDQYKKLKENLMGEAVTTLTGMPGIGKTTLAIKLFHDPEMVKHFHHRVWVRVGKKYGVKDIPRRILAEINPKSLERLPEGDEDAVNEYLKARLESKRYLIVLDDVWDRYITYLLHPYSRYEYKNLKHPFLHEDSRSRILFISRLQQLKPSQHHLPSDIVLRMRLLNKEESWDLLREKVFPEGPCPPQLQTPGKKTSENCEGLPLTIVVVARLLAQQNSTLDFWNEVAGKKNHQLYKDAYEEMSKVLLPSYNYLSRFLQTCFFFLGLFRQNYEIPRSKLINLWHVDGFKELKNITVESDMEYIYCLEELVSNNLVMVYQECTLNIFYTVKTCGLHSSLWHLSNKKARETKFSLILNSRSEFLADGIKGHHRLSFHSHVLFAIKDVHNAVVDNFASTARSLLCYGPYLQYQVPVCFGLRFLKELDALLIRFYEFPMEVLQLDQLRYLTLTSNGMIPASISKLSNLQFIVVDRHQSIKSCKEPSYLPVEIWGMKELKLLQVTGSDLPDPCGASLLSLSKLFNVSASSCTEDVFNAIPFLNELRIRIQLPPDDDIGEPLSCFTYISHLRSLESLKCVVVNPDVVPRVAPFSNFPASFLIERLSLSGLGYPWKEMSKLASLPKLMVLKLKNYAFQGPDWEVEETGFLSLDSIVVEDTDLVDWKIGYGAFIGLQSIRIKHCYKLKKIHGEFVGHHLGKIEVVDCNPSGVDQLKMATQARTRLCVVDIHSSWVDKRLKK